jgi:hypothetical protein
VFANSDENDIIFEIMRAVEKAIPSLKRGARVHNQQD